MKKILLIIPVCLLAGIIHAQTIIEKHIDFTNKESVSLNIQIADSIRIIPWDKNEVYVRASVDVNDNKDNDKYQWTFGGNGKEVDINAKISDNAFKSINRNNCCCNQINVYCEVHVPSRAKLRIETINGDLILDRNTHDMHLKTISGFIDLSAPSDLAADLEFKTITGLVYTNFALDVDDRHHSGPTDFSSSLNGGGNPISLETISGNIYFRKAD